MLIFQRNHFKKALLVIFAAALTLMFTSCEIRDFFNYAQQSFVVTVEGNFDKSRFKAQVFSKKNTDENGEGYELTVTFLSPESLNGLTADMFSDGSFGIRLGALEDSGNQFEYLFVPFKAITPMEGYSSVVKLPPDRYEVSFINDFADLKYIFSSNSIFPEEISGTLNNKCLYLKLYNFELLNEKCY